MWKKCVYDFAIGSDLTSYLQLDRRCGCYEQILMKFFGAGYCRGGPLTGGLMSVNRWARPREQLIDWVLLAICAVHYGVYTGIDIIYRVANKKPLQKFHQNLFITL